MKLVIFTITLASVVGPLYALDCYRCSYDPLFGGDVCKDTFDTASLNSSSYVTTFSCSGSCTKTVLTVDGEVTSASRSCSPSCSAGCSSVFSVKSCINCCSEDYCNGATNVHMSIIAVMAALLVALGFSR